MPRVPVVGADGTMLPPPPRVPEGIASGTAVGGWPAVPGVHWKNGLGFHAVFVDTQAGPWDCVGVASETATETRKRTRMSHNSIASRAFSKRTLSKLAKPGNRVLPSPLMT